MGGGDDVVEIRGYETNDNIIKGGQGSDTYIFEYLHQGSNHIINNYDTDGGKDILSLGRVGMGLDDYKAEFNGDDLLVNQYSGEALMGSLVIEDYGLGSNYQIDEFHFSETIYTAEQFLAEMGLTM